MNSIKLTENGSRITDVFSPELLSELVSFADTFVPADTRDTYDAPHLTAPLAGARRESIKLTHGDLWNKIVDCFPQITGHSIAIEFWRDYPGFRNAIHLDFDYVENIIIVYLDGSGGNNMGTAFYEDTMHIADYELNTGIVLMNSNKIEHHMFGTVSDVDYRKTLYINWCKK